jgi:hypothetical protein
MFDKHEAEQRETRELAEASAVARPARGVVGSERAKKSAVRDGVSDFREFS